MGKGADPDALRENVGFVTGEQPHRAVKARTGVPAGIGRFRIVNGHMDGMDFSICQAGAIYKAIAVAIVGKGRFSAVQKNLTHRVNALKQQHGAAAFRERKFLFIFIASASEVGRTGTAGVFLLPLFQQHGIVGHGNRSQHFSCASEAPGIGKISFLHKRASVFLSLYLFYQRIPPVNYRKTEKKYRDPDLPCRNGFFSRTDALY